MFYYFVRAICAYAYSLCILSCVFSTSAEGNTPRGVPHRVQSNVDAAETPSDGLMPQSHLATLTSFPGAAHHMCTVPLCIFYAFLGTSMHFGLGHTASDSRSRTHGLGHTVSDTRSRTYATPRVASPSVTRTRTSSEQ